MQTILSMASFCIGYFVFGSPAVASTMVFLTLGFIQLFHSYNMRSANRTVVHKDLFTNKVLNLSFLLGAVLLLAVVLIPGLNAWFGAVTLDWKQWLIALGCAIAIVPFVEIQKIIENKIKASK